MNGEMVNWPHHRRELNGEMVYGLGEMVKWFMG